MQRVKCQSGSDLKLKLGKESKKNYFFKSEKMLIIKSQTIS